MEQEQWKDIEGYEGLYQVSQYGNVQSLSKQELNFISPGHILKRRFDYQGDVFVTLYKQGQTRINTKVYKLVAQHFVDNPEGKTTVIHKDKNILNNHMNNLEWV